MKIFKTLGKTLLAAYIALGLAGCGEEIKRPIIDEKYIGVYKAITDPQDQVLPEDEKGDLEIYVLPLDSDNVNVNILGWHDYENIGNDFKQGDNGYVEGNWNYDIDGGTTSFYVKGTIANDRINLDAFIEHLNFKKNYKYHIEWELKGIKAKR